MGCNIGDDGKYTKWSDLFDYSSEETLKASQRLPIADNCTVYESEGGFDISGYVKDYESNSASWDSALKLNWMANLLYNLEDFRRTYNDKDVHVTPINNNEVKLMLKKHYGTKLSDEIQDAAYKNFVSSNILNTIQDPRNFISAYTPISMDDLLDAAKDSSKAQATRNLNLMNPATKWIMQTQNMTGKTVIGITAVGEKIYFNMCFLWNEALNKASKGDLSKMKYVKFNQTFDRILGRFSGKVLKKTVQCLADVNIDSLSVEQLHLIFSDDVLVQYSANSGLGKEPQDFTKDDFDNMVHTQLGVDIMISQLLSAATDNAKELILEKINCDSNFAKYYLHLLMMGFDIKDCVKYMTSGAVETITELTKTNFFDPQQEEIPTWVALSEAKFKVYPNRYIKGEAKSVYDEEPDLDPDDYESSKPNTRASEFILKINITYEDVLKNLKTLKGKGFTDEQISKLIDKIVLSKNEATGKVTIDPIAAFMVVQLTSDNPVSISTVILNKNTGKPAKLTEDEQVCVNRIDYIVNKVKSKLTDDYTIFDYLDDIDQFTKLDDLANETSNVGNTFLGMNQGIPTDKDGLVSKLNQIEETINNRLKKLIPQAWKLGTSEYKVAGKNDPKFDDIVKALVENSGINEGEVKRILKLAIAYGICGDFDSEKWLYNIKLDEKSLVNRYVLGDNHSIAIQPTTYRKLTMEFYNLLKLTWNPFYAMSELPLFNAIVDLLAVEVLYDIESSAKSNIISAINDDLRSKGIKIKKESLSKFRPYADKLLLDAFLNENPIQVILPDNISGLRTSYFKTNGELESVDHSVELNMSLLLDRATLKMYVEDVLLPYMKSDSLFKDMLLIKDLNVAINRDGSSSLQVPIDLSDPHSSNESTKVFAKYQQEISELGKYTIPENPKIKVIDILMLYNLIVNCNRYGSNRLTGLFLSYVLNNDDCLLRTYFRWLGNLDFNNPRDLLTLLNYEKSDALLEVAEVVRENRLIDYDKNRVVKVYDKGKMRYIYKSYDKNLNIWKELNYYGNRKLSALSEVEVNLFSQHWVNMLPKASLIAENYINIAYSTKVSDVMAALRYFQNIGKLTIIKDNCE